MSSSSSTRRSREAHSHSAHGGGGESRSGDGGGGDGGGGGGGLVKVGFARNEPEAEMMQALLLEEGMPSVLKRAAGFDNPDFLAAGPRDIFVAQANAQRARQLLADTALESGGEERDDPVATAAWAHSGSGISFGRWTFWMIAAMVGAVLLVWLLYQTT